LGQIDMQTLPSRFQNWMSGHARSRPSASELPLRAELFSVEQLARHAKALAATHQVVTQQVPTACWPGWDTTRKY